MNVLKMIDNAIYAWATRDLERKLAAMEAGTWKQSWWDRMMDKDWFFYGSIIVYMVMAVVVSNYVASFAAASFSVL